MLESNPSRNSRLEIHLNGEPGRRPCGSALDHSDRFPHAFKLINRSCREAASLFLPRQSLLFPLQSFNGRA